MISEGDLITSVGARLKQLRQAAGLTQMAMAARLGVDLRGYQRAESGSANLTLRTLARLASALGVSPSGLLGETDAP